MALRDQIQKAQSMPSVAHAMQGRAPDECVLQPKYDGWRVLVEYRADGTVRIIVGNGSDVSGHLPALTAEVRRRVPPDSVLDGEIIGKRRGWNDVQSMLGSGQDRALRLALPLEFVCFDVLRVGGNDWTGAPYHTRAGGIDALFADPWTNASGVMQLPATQEAHDALVAAGWEGSILRHLDAPYVPGGRGRGVFKLKWSNTVDVIITGFTEGGGKYRGQIGAIKFRAADGRTGQCSGMSDAQRAHMSAHQAAMVGTVIEISYNRLENGSGFRHPQFLRVRPDKPATEVA